MMNRDSKIRLLMLVVLAASVPLCLGGVAGCNWMTTGAPKGLRQGVVVKCNQPKATLYIDERIVGALHRTQGLRVGLAPGTYRMVVRLPGYFTRYMNVKISRDKYQTLTIALRRELD